MAVSVIRGSVVSAALPLQSARGPRSNAPPPILRGRARPGRSRPPTAARFPARPSVLTSSREPPRPALDDFAYGSAHFIDALLLWPGSAFRTTETAHVLPRQSPLAGDLWHVRRRVIADLASTASPLTIGVVQRCRESDPLGVIRPRHPIGCLTATVRRCSAQRAANVTSGSTSVRHLDSGRADHKVSTAPAERHSSFLALPPHGSPHATARRTSQLRPCADCQRPARAATTARRLLPDLERPRATRAHPPPPVGQVLVVRETGTELLDAGRSLLARGTGRLGLFCPPLARRLPRQTGGRTRRAERCAVAMSGDRQRVGRRTWFSASAFPSAPTTRKARCPARSRVGTGEARCRERRRGSD